MYFKFFWDQNLPIRPNCVQRSFLIQQKINKNPRDHAHVTLHMIPSPRSIFITHILTIYNIVWIDHWDKNYWNQAKIQRFLRYTRAKNSSTRFAVRTNTRKHSPMLWSLPVKQPSHWLKRYIVRSYMKFPLNLFVCFRFLFKENCNCMYYINDYVSC